MNGNSGQQVRDDHDDHALENKVAEEHSSCYTKMNTPCTDNDTDSGYELNSPSSQLLEHQRYECSKYDIALEPSQDNCIPVEVDDGAMPYDEDYDPVEDTMTRLKAKISMLHEKRRVPDQQIGLLLTVNGNVLITT